MISTLCFSHAGAHTTPPIHMQTYVVILLRHIKLFKYRHHRFAETYVSPIVIRWAGSQAKMRGTLMCLNDIYNTIKFDEAWVTDNSIPSCVFFLFFYYPWGIAEPQWAVRRSSRCIHLNCVASLWILPFVHPNPSASTKEKNICTYKQ